MKFAHLLLVSGSIGAVTCAPVISAGTADIAARDTPQGIFDDIVKGAIAHPDIVSEIVNKLPSGILDFFRPKPPPPPPPPGPAPTEDDIVANTKKLEGILRSYGIAGADGKMRPLISGVQMQASKSGQEAIGNDLLFRMISLFQGGKEIGGHGPELPADIQAALDAGNSMSDLGLAPDDAAQEYVFMVGVLEQAMEEGAEGIAMGLAP